MTARAGMRKGSDAMVPRLAIPSSGLAPAWERPSSHRRAGIAMLPGRKRRASLEPPEPLAGSRGGGASVHLACASYDVERCRRAADLLRHRHGLRVCVNEEDGGKEGACPGPSAACTCAVVAICVSPQALGEGLLASIAEEVSEARRELRALLLETLPPGDGAESPAILRALAAGARDPLGREGDPGFDSRLADFAAGLQAPLYSGDKDFGGPWAGETGRRARLFVAFHGTEEAHASLVQRAVERLRRDGMACWVSTGHAPDAEAESAAAAALGSCTLVLALVSPSSTTSHRFLRELRVARDLERPVVPLYLEVPPPGQEAPTLAVLRRSGAAARRAVREEEVSAAAAAALARPEEELAGLLVDPASPLPPATGVYPSLAACLAKADEGDLVWLAPCKHAVHGSVEIPVRVMLQGASAPPGSPGPVLALGTTGRLELTCPRGGSIASLTISGESAKGSPSALLAARVGRWELHGCRLLAGGRPRCAAVHAPGAAHLLASRCVFAGASAAAVGVSAPPPAPPPDPDVDGIGVRPTTAAGYGPDAAAARPPAVRDSLVTACRGGPFGTGPGRATGCCVNVLGAPSAVLRSLSAAQSPNVLLCRPVSPDDPAACLRLLRGAHALMPPPPGPAPPQSSPHKGPPAPPRRRVVPSESPPDGPLAFTLSEAALNGRPGEAMDLLPGLHVADRALEFRGTALAGTSSEPAILRLTGPSALVASEPAELVNVSLEIRTAFDGGLVGPWRLRSCRLSLADGRAAELKDSEDAESWVAALPLLSPLPSAPRWLARLAAWHASLLPAFRERLLAIVHASPSSTADPHLASAALSLLHAARHSFAGADLRGIKAPGAWLAGLEAAGADLSGADLSHAELVGSNLAGADLRGAVLDGAVLQLLRWHRPAGARVLTFSRCGRVLACVDSSEPGIVRLLDAATGEAAGPPLAAPAGPIKSVAPGFDKAGKIAAATATALLLWDLARPGPPRAVDLPSPSPESAHPALALSSDGASAAVACGAGLFLVSGAATRTVALQPPPACATFAPDGRRLACGGPEGRAWVLEAATGATLAELAPRPSRGRVEAAAFDEGGTLLSLAFASKGGPVRARRWDPAAGLLSPAVEARGGRPALSPDGRFLATAEGPAAFLHCLDTGESLGEFRSEGRPPVACLALGPGAASAASASGASLCAWAPCRSPAARVESAPPVRNVVMIATSSLVASREPPAAAVAAHAPLAALSSPAAGLCCLWGPALGAPVPLDEPPSEVACMAFSPDDSLLAVLRRDGSLCLRDALRGTLVASFDEDASARDGSCVAFSPDGSLFACGGRHGSVCVRSVSDGSRSFVVPPEAPDAAALLALGFSADGSGLVAVGRRGLREWSLGPGGPAPRRASATEHPLTCAAVGPAGAYVVASAEGSEGGVLLLWDLRADGTDAPPLARLALPPSFAGPVAALAACADAAAAAGASGALCLAPLDGNSAAVLGSGPGGARCAAASARLLALGLADGSVRLMDRAAGLRCAFRLGRAAALEAAGAKVGGAGLAEGDARLLLEAGADAGAPPSSRPVASGSLRVPLLAP